jgi:hypothetical protein
MPTIYHPREKVRKPLDPYGDMQKQWDERIYQFIKRQQEVWKRKLSLPAQFAGEGLKKNVSVLLQTGITKNLTNMSQTRILCKVCENPECYCTCEKTTTQYDTFIRSALNAGFTDDQVNWLERYIYEPQSK